MSTQKLKDLGDQIRKAVENSPLQTEIALISLESIHKLLVSTDQNSNQDDMMHQPMPHGQNMFPDQQMGYGQPIPNNQPMGYNYDETIPPANITTLGPSYIPDIMSQANNVPFLYHETRK